MTIVFGNFDITDFWDNTGADDYIEKALTDKMVTSVEEKIGYKLPQTYIELMKAQNGGTPKLTNHRMKKPTSWAEDHIAITGIFGIGKSNPYSLCGKMGSQFWINKWEYPAIGIYFCDCPSAGHDMLCLDYRKCGPEGEPRVVHVDQELDYKISVVAKNFETFIRGLEGDDAFDHD